MKKTISVITIFILALAALPVVADDSVNPRQMPFYPVTAKFELRNTPDIKVGNYGNRHQSSSRHKWGALEAEFTPRQIPGNPNFWMDSVKMELMILVPTDLGNNKVGYAVFTGTTSFWTVHFDGKTHKAMMAVPPQLIDRTLTAGNFTPDSFLARVRFTSAGQLLGEAYTNSVRKEQMALFAAAETNDPNMVKIEGALLPKNKTPWQYIDYDIYDLVKE